MFGKHQRQNEAYDRLRRMAFLGPPESSSDASLDQHAWRERLATARHSQQKWLAWEKLRSLGVQPSPSETGVVLGVIAEFAVAGSPVTVVAFPEGDASVYIRGGGGVIGGGAHEEVRQAAGRLLAIAGEVGCTFPLAAAPPPPPDRGEIVFNVLTPGGLRSMREVERSVRSTSHRLNATYGAMHDLITRLRQRASHHAVEPNDKERAYLNGLLTVLAENRSGVVIIDSARPVPTLRSIAMNNDQRAWLRSESIDEDGVRSTVVIRELCGLARFGLFQRRKGRLQAQLVTRHLKTLPYLFHLERRKRPDGEELLLRL